MRIKSCVIAACVSAVLVGFSVAAAASSSQRISCRVEMDRTVLPAGAPQQAVVKVSLNASALTEETGRAPVNVAFVLDRSGSMSGVKIEDAKAAAISAMRQLGQQDLVSVVAYNHRAETLVSARSAAEEDILRQIERVAADGDTALFGGVSQAAAALRKNLSGDYVHRIILLSDGLANVGPHSPEDLGRLGASLIKEGISVSTVGVGEDFNEDLMAELALHSDGNIYFTQSSDMLARIFATELGAALNVAAKNIELEVIFPENVRPRRVIGSGGRIRQNRVELTYNQICGGQQKYALIEVELDQTPEDAMVQVAQARVTYQDALSGGVFTAVSGIEACFSAQQNLIQSSRNIGVINDYNLSNNANAVQRAIDLADDGDLDQAVQVLNMSAEQLEIVGKANNDPRLIDKAKTVKGQAEEIEQQGHMSNFNRKTMRTEGYQDLQQQSGR